MANSAILQALINEIEFFEKREPAWRRLNQLCAKADVAPTQLSGTEIREIFKLYRDAGRDLALARSKSQNLELINFLNDLVSRAYAILYRRKRGNLASGIRTMLVVAAQTFRRRLAFVAVSAALFFGSGVFGLLALQAKPELRSVLIRPEMEPNFEQWKTGVQDEKTFDEGAAGTAFYMSNNPMVSVQAAGIAGATFGLGTAYVLFNNGLLIGALTHELMPVNRVGYLFIRILPHGVPELSGIIVSGAAGLLMGYGLLFPGRRSRWDSLRSVGKDAATLVCTAVVLMYIAAPIEGYFSFNGAVPDIAKMVFTAVSLVAWTTFWAGFGRNEPDPMASSSLAP